MHTEIEDSCARYAAIGRIRILAVCSTSLVACLAICTPVSAQQSSGIADIVVTAQRREQVMQKVPVAVTAITQDALQVNRVQNIMDLTSLAPGLTAKANAGGAASPSFTMRGVFASASQPSSDRQISTYIDGIYIGATRGSVFDLPDIERIEVLRGPQGTLFGRNATAGAINVLTRDPTGEFHARQELTIGNYDQLRTRTSIDLPQIGPFSAYFTYVHDERRGDVRNLGVGTTFDRTSPFTGVGAQRSPRYLGGKNTENYFAAVKFAPTHDFSMVYKFDRSDGTFTPEARDVNLVNAASNSIVATVLTGVVAAQTPGGGAYGPIAFNPGNRRPGAVNNAWAEQGYVKGSGHSLTSVWHVSDHLTFKNITGYRRSVVYAPASIGGLDGLEYTAAAKAFYTAPRPELGGASYATFLDPIGHGAEPVGTYFAGYDGNNYGKASQFSTELQANYDSELLTFTLGGLYYHSKEFDGGLPQSPANFGFAPVPELVPLGNIQVPLSKTDSIAAYAQGEIHVTRKLDVTLGGRITKDKKDVTYTTGGTFEGSADRSTGDLVGASVLAGSFSKTKPSYAIGVNYTPLTNVMVYGKYSTAFLSGGRIGDAPAFQPETVRSWELGLKSEFLDRKVRLNLALYDAKYEHSQSSQSGQNVGLPQYSVVVIDNGPLRARGVEAELTVAPARGLTLGGSVAYTDAKLTDPNIIATQGRPYALIGTGKWNGSVNAQYVTGTLFDEASMLFRIDGNYQGKYRQIPFLDLATVSPALEPYAFNPARWVVNGRIALRDIKAGSLKGEVALWARNLFNNKDPMYLLAFGDYLVNSSYQQARTFGLDFIVRY